MKASVIKAFGDKSDGNRLYMPGDVFESGDARIADLESQGFVVREPEPKPKAATRRRAAKPKE